MTRWRSRAMKLRAAHIGAAFAMWLMISLVHAGEARAEAGVILTFDDAYIEEWHAIRPLLDELGVRATFFVTRYYALNAAQRQLVSELVADGHEIASHSYDHANATTYCPGGLSGCTITDGNRARFYIEEQILPQLAEMATDGIHPRNFAYPFGADLGATTQLLLRYFDYVRDTSYYPNHDESYVTCGSDRFIAGLGIDHVYSVSDSQYDGAMDDAVVQDTNLVWYGHGIQFQSAGYYVGESRLRDLILRAQSRGLVFRRMRDLCSWVTLGRSGPPLDVLASARPLSDVRFGDFDGDGISDAFRTNGGTWEVLLGQGNGFYDGAGTEHWQYLNTSGHELDELRLGDFDGNGVTDVFRTTAGLWFVSFGGTGTWTHVQSSGYPLGQLRFHDIDGNGSTDIFTVNGTEWLVSYGAASTWSYLGSAGHPIESLRFGDFDGNGSADVFVSSGGTWSVRYGATGAWDPINVSGYGVEDLALADIDGNGRADVLRADGTSWLVSYDGTGTWTPLATSAKTLADAAFVDIGGDGGMDILVVDDPIAVPEPGASAGLVGSLALLVATRRRRERSRLRSTAGISAITPSFDPETAERRGRGPLRMQPGLRVQGALVHES